MNKPLLVILTVLAMSPAFAWAAPREIRVFVALCDNASQGIVPVPPRIGDGNRPDDNLYWGCTEGFRSWFKRSACWKLTKTEASVSRDILERLQFRHATADAVLTAEAYRGSSIRKCLTDFEAAVALGKYALVAYIGHNGLMDFDLPAAKPPKSNSTDVIVLCCKSRPYFADRLSRLQARPILTTEQLMYPGSFILHDAIEVWLRNGAPAEIRTAAAKAYAKNQGISVKAAAGIFSQLERGAVAPHSTFSK
jgi:hypothetical protein